MTDIETPDVFEAKARQIVEKIQRDLFRSDIHPSEARKEHIAAIASALEAERLEERAACERIAIAMFEDCTTGQDCSAIEAEMRDRLAAKDASIREYMDICEDLSRKLEASRHRVAELEARLEIDHEFEFDPEKREFVRVEIPSEERSFALDGIACRDVTIKLQEEFITKHLGQIAELEAALRAAIKSHDKIPPNIPLPSWVENARSTLEGKHPNAESLAAIQELEDGGGETFSSVDDLMRLKTEKE